ncbi:hypothetical protein AALO_G00084540 [Alosa alosa]|uniref:Uncharacterized protein n=1 Tax=Alosa alosa TaxID=278164 RepID=A0AAV6H1V2_9TELE|nr:hypothetical protein AALO_G00084540 [Alosa alosa]
MAESSFRIPHVLSEGQLDPNFQEGRLRRPTPDKRELDQWVKELERKVARDRMRDKLRHMREAVHRRSQEMWTRRWEWHIYQETQKKKQKERQAALSAQAAVRGYVPCSRALQPFLVGDRTGNRLVTSPKP